MIEYRNQPDRALLAWQLRRAKRRRAQVVAAAKCGTNEPEAQEVGQPTAIENTDETTSPDHPKEGNENGTNE